MTGLSWDLRTAYGRMLETRGPFYRRLCITIAEKVAARKVRAPVSLDPYAAELYRAGFVAGCKAVAEEIRRIDE